MKELKRYMCEHCQTEYAQKSDAEKCERGHTIIQKVARVRYVPISSDESGHPISIAAEMSDGSTVVYKR
ncbi:hypothetical protein [Selenomonas artemidis]|uniref:hypothetical protein n=1 Tax=Selenomonas artemidis TaxID=671224 RepID=UPI00204700CD|nr:hypothetical protein [Selenomonas artemidis]DAK40405.1 MAG TPA: C2H2 type zinc-finger protein [Caudoviricetes sp.]